MQSPSARRNALGLLRHIAQGGKSGYSSVPLEIDQTIMSVQVSGLRRGIGDEAVKNLSLGVML
jgi:hypothetical protein